MAIESRDNLLSEFMEFFRNYKTDEGEFRYIEKINRMIRDGQRSLVVDYEDLVLMDDTYEYDLVDTLLQNPDFAIDIASDALSSQVRIENNDFYKLVTREKDPFTIRFSNLPAYMSIRDLRANHVDSIRWFEGIVIRTTEIKSIITEAIYHCIPNNHQNKLFFEHGIYKKPDYCIETTCKAKDFVLDTRESKMLDWQFMTLQEKPEDLPPGASPKSVPCRLIDDVVNSVRPGDRVQVAGIVRTRPSKQMKKGQILTYEIWVDVNYVESLTKEDEFTLISPEEEKRFLDLASDPKIHEYLLESVAPAIFGMERVKEAGLVVLFGGVDKVFPDGFTTRGQPNVLLVGDPGIAKSQMLKYIQSIAPRGLYTSGKGSSAAGLTAAIIRDPDTGEITLEAGALVLADRGICLIDEFDKMNENDRSAIHEAMEQNTISVAKAGIVATLNARTGVFAAANPKYGRYEPQRTFSDNVNLSPAILSRFDLVFVLQDDPEEEQDAVLANHILGLHQYHGSVATKKPPLTEDELRKYIAYAKTHYNPVLTDEASEVLEEYYVEMRNSYGKSGEGGSRNRVTITARQLEGIVRLAEARSRAALRNEVTKHDALMAIELMKYSLSQIAVDPSTGEPDIDSLYSGQTHSRRTNLSKLMSIIDFLNRESGGKPFDEIELYAEADKEKIDRGYVEGAIEQLKRDGALYTPRPGKLKKPDK